MKTEQRGKGKKWRQSYNVFLLFFHQSSHPLGSAVAVTSRIIGGVGNTQRYAAPRLRDIFPTSLNRQKIFFEQPTLPLFRFFFYHPLYALHSNNHGCGSSTWLWSPFLPTNKKGRALPLLEGCISQKVPETHVSAAQPAPRAPIAKLIRHTLLRPVSNIGPCKFA